MSFMQPDIRHDTFTRLETTEGTELAPFETSDIDHFAGKPVGEFEQATGWFARLSAPGYMDCTDWSGPFETAELAAEHLRDMYGDDDE